MKYYKVKPEHDNKTRYTWNNHHHGIQNGIIIGNELYTPCEFKKLAMRPEWFEQVNIKKTSTYFFFGARFTSAQ